MYKLVILIEKSVETAILDQLWPQFLRNAEQMPGLLRESTSRVDVHLYGSAEYQLQHELFFNSPEEARQAMASEAGRAAGRILQQLSGGQVVLFFADHREDDLENIRKRRPSFSSSE
ncbi:MAG: EthD family reductase [Anaerolineales bacterium]|nr:EthD family reductase [Anaerolineales bacterium]MCS7247600.1 EthD family reductase [Anaerolineales bacterium]MDW8161411.1 EthD family reductase [Anaerolineales bacterium]MDW8446662.1 EthD family reductase [Anaerolineales bacterium]